MSNKLNNLNSVFVLSILLLGCQHNSPAPNPNLVLVPTSDSTFPTVGMTINDNNKINIDVNEKSQPTTINAGSNTVTVIAGAIDEDGGIKAVKLWATFTHYKPDQISNSGLAGAPIKQDVSNAQIGEFTLKNRFFSYNFDMKKELGSWSNIKIDVWAEGENFYGQKVSTPKVSITYPISILNPTPGVDVCARVGGAPMITIPTSSITVLQTPGRDKSQ